MCGKWRGRGKEARLIAGTYRIEPKDGVSVQGETYRILGSVGGGSLSFGYQELLFNKRGASAGDKNE